MTRAFRHKALSRRKILIGAVLLALVAGGCATTGLSRQDVVRQDNVIAQLSDGLEDARGQDGTLLAPNMFDQAKRQLDDAYEYAQRADKRIGSRYSRQSNSSVSSNPHDTRTRVSCRSFSRVMKNSSPF